MLAKFTGILAALIAAVFVFAVMYHAPAEAIQTDINGTTISLTQEESDMCAAEGGCIFLTQKTADALVEYVKKLKAEASKTCGTKI